MSAPPCKIVVSIINFRTAEMTIACVQSVLDDLCDIAGRVVVVDNFSQDGSAERIRDWIDNQPTAVPVDLVLSPTNSGFSGGHNQGMAAHEAEYYLVLNSDGLVRPGFFKAILAAADATPGAGFFAPRIEGEDGVAQTSCFRFHGPLSELIRAARFGPVTRLLKRHEVALGPDPDPDQIEWASFACILLRGDMVRALGPMDEGYFLYYEDAEYCLRARRAGWRIAYVPQAIAVHFRGGSGPVKSLATARKRLPPYYYSSRARFLYQAHGWTGLLAANLAWHFGRVIANLSRLAGRKIGPMSRLEGRDIWTNTLSPLGPRRAPGETGGPPL